MTKIYTSKKSFRFHQFWWSMSDQDEPFEVNVYCVNSKSSHVYPFCFLTKNPGRGTAEKKYKL